MVPPPAPATTGANGVALAFDGIGAVRALSVRDTARWMLSGELSVDWVSFNYEKGSETVTPTSPGTQV